MAATSSMTARMGTKVLLLSLLRLMEWPNLGSC
jgi:hypothetical protein